MKTSAATLQADGPPFPDPLDYLWSLFVEHSAGLVPVAEGYPRVTWESLRAWGVELELWERRVLINLGNIRANVHAKWRAEQLKLKAGK